MKIISGGQTGADLGGLEGAELAGVETGGTAPSNFYTEAGSNYVLRDKYNLVAKGTFKSRTVQNIIDSDGTVIFSDKLDSSGTICTVNNCRAQHKPYLCNPTVEELLGFISFHKIEVLNVAGNRESVAPGIQKRTRETIYKVLTSEKIVDDRWIE